MKKARETLWIAKKRWDGRAFFTPGFCGQDEAEVAHKLISTYGLSRFEEMTNEGLLEIVEVWIEEK